MYDSTFYSGGAKGSDTQWASCLRKNGFYVKEYTVQDYDALTPQWKTIINNQYTQVAKMIGRYILNENSYSGKLVRRDMMQADKATAIFAICRLDNNLNVLGGTAYAVTRALIRKIPVYIYDQNSNTWWNFQLTQNGNIWRQKLQSEAIHLINHSAVIGTREINTNGIKTIQQLVQKYKK